MQIENTNIHVLMGCVSARMGAAFVCCWGHGNAGDLHMFRMKDSHVHLVLTTFYITLDYTSVMLVIKSLRITLHYCLTRRRIAEQGIAVPVPAKDIVFPHFSGKITHYNHCLQYNT